MTYDADYENEPIGGGNPYHRCIHCKLSDPYINGDVKKHSADCFYRASKEAGVPYKPFDANGCVNVEFTGADMACKLTRICHNCGEIFGRHKAESSQCPVIEDGRTVGFLEHQCFDLWMENT